MNLEKQSKPEAVRSSLDEIRRSKHKKNESPSQTYMSPLENKNILIDHFVKPDDLISKLESTTD